jgi:hypothetical protein
MSVALPLFWVEEDEKRKVYISMEKRRKRKEKKRKVQKKLIFQLCEFKNNST